MDFSKYRFRSHWVGNIISVPKPLTKDQKETLDSYSLRALGEGKMLTENQKKVLIDLKYKEQQSNEYRLTDGQKKLLNELYFYEKYSRRKDLDIKFFKKGLDVEKNARDLLSKVTGLYLTHSPENRKNEWVTGITDVLPTNGVVLDIKSAWNFESYSTILMDSANEKYLRQLDCYMDLWDCNRALLCHVLIDTPFQIIHDELKRQSYKYNWLDFGGNVRIEFIDDVVSLITNHIYSFKALEAFVHESINLELSWFKNFKEVPENERVHMITHEFNHERIEQRNECIKIARDYLNTVKPLNNVVKI